MTLGAVGRIWRAGLVGLGSAGWVGLGRAEFICLWSAGLIGLEFAGLIILRTILWAVGGGIILIGVVLDLNKAPAGNIDL